MKETLISIPCSASQTALNPSLLPSGDGYMLAYRFDALTAPYPKGYKLNANQYWGWQVVAMQKMDRKFKLVGEPVYHFEGQDPRLFRAFKKTWCSYATSPRSWRWWLSEVTDRFEEPFLPDYRTNRYVIGGPEKNWTWIDNPELGSFDCIYSWNPFIALRFDQRGERTDLLARPEWDVKWENGSVRGGSPSILLPSGERFSAFHGCLSDDDPDRLYKAGGVFHEPEWPYRPIRVVQRPLLTATRRFKRWPDQKCDFIRTRVVYPCGAVAEPERVLVGYGVDDCRCAVAEFSYAELI